MLLCHPKKNACQIKKIVTEVFPLLALPTVEIIICLTVGGATTQVYSITILKKITSTTNVKLLKKLKGIILSVVIFQVNDLDLPVIECRLSR